MAYTFFLSKYSQSKSVPKISRRVYLVNPYSMKRWAIFQTEGGLWCHQGKTKAFLSLQSHDNYTRPKPMLGKRRKYSASPFRSRNQLLKMVRSRSENSFPGGLFIFTTDVSRVTDLTCRRLKHWSKKNDGSLFITIIIDFEQQKLQVC